MSSRYLIGLDLGTTNSAVAYIDTTERLRAGRPTIHRFNVPQLVEGGETGTRETLPSFLYFPTEHDATIRPSTAGEMEAVGGEAIDLAVAGVFARDHGALVPSRQVTSAKSWLCNPAVDRRARILPWGRDADEIGCSPVAASACYIAHLRDAWNHEHESSDGERFERQDIVLTVPASFDEEARELTVQAARDAGLRQLTLLEEPLAAFYAWIATHARSFRRQLADGDDILVCDVGGGTTDFTLIRASITGGEVRFERTAVGEHLLLGGDNLDLALARRIQAKLGDARLTLRQQQALARLSAIAKEALLADRGSDRTTVVVPAAGRSVVGGRLSAELTRDEVVATLREGFLPQVAANDLPARSTRAGLREFGLPYAAEPAITRHLAAFLTRAARAEGTNPAEAGSHVESRGSYVDQRLVRPEAVLFNGGFFTPEVARDAIVRVLESWFRDKDPTWHLKVLVNRQPAMAVAVGGAYYAFARAHGGARVSGGSARAYYVGLRAQAQAPGTVTAEESPLAARTCRPAVSARVTTVCVMPRGTEEGTPLDLADRVFTVATNRPVAFPLFSSTNRQDRLGDLVVLDRTDAHEHAPLVTILRYGKKSRQAELPVHLSARFTEVGTLEIWCDSNVSEHRWRLQFELRATEHAADEEEADVDRGTDDQASVVIPDAAIAEAAALVRNVFATGQGAATARAADAGDSGPEALVARLENVLGYARQVWPLAVIRRLADVLLDVAEGRKKGARFEARWLNLAGFCLRPGLGATLDDWRMEQLRRVYMAGPLFPRELQNQAEWLVLWQRVAGGLTAGQQQEIYQRHRILVGFGGKKEGKRVNPQVEREGWRLLASLELLPAPTRASLGNQLVTLVRKHPYNSAFLWSLGRLGARIPSYGPLNNVVPVGTVSEWIDDLLTAAPSQEAADPKRTGRTTKPRPEGTGDRDRPSSADIHSSLVQMAARTDDLHRDVDADIRSRVIAYLEGTGATPEDVARLTMYVPPATSDAARMFGEMLPEGLRLSDGTVVASGE